MKFKSHVTSSGYTLTSQKATPLTLLPKRSISGPYKHNPKMSGTTTIMAPDTPDLAGRPTYSVLNIAAHRVTQYTGQG